MDVKHISVNEIRPYEKNPRNNEKAIKFVVASLREFGWQQPIVVDVNGVIIAGHTRYKAALQLGMKEVPVIVADKLNDDQVKAYRLADNKTNEKSTWIDELVLEERNDIKLDMHDFGFEEINIETTEDGFEPILPKEPKTIIGDIYKLGIHRLMCGDSTLVDSVEKLMDGDKADFVFTDPPWNVDYGGSDHPSWKKRSILNDKMSTENFNEFLSTSFISMNSVSKPGAMVYVVMSAQEWGNIMDVLSEQGYHWSSTIIWNKDHHVMSRKDYHTKYEPIWYGWKDGAPRLCPLEDRKQSDVWDINRPVKSEEHPTMKPVELVARAIYNSSTIGSIVLDLFGGSGTTLIACEQTKRRCYMMELDPKYCDVIVSRWEKLTGNVAILEKVNCDGENKT